MKRIDQGSRAKNRNATMTKRHRNNATVDQEAPITLFRRAGFFLKTICVVVTVAFLGLYLQPLAMAAQLPSQQTPTPKEPSNEEKLAKHLEKIQDKLDRLDQKLTAKQDAKSEEQDLKTLRQDLDTLDKQAIDDFGKIEQHLKDKKLPQVILDRHTEAVKQYTTEMATLKANLDDLDKAKDDERTAKARKAKEHLSAKHKKRGPKTKFDPNDLPNKSLQPNPNNKPKLTKEQFIRAGLHSNPYEKFAAHGSYNFAQLAGASDPAYLAATTEVTLTPAIQAKAAELEHNPVKIYNWVRNNVEWLPTWGATQDADVTLGSKRGNAMDIASLLIALLRASGIPSRYVHGTIEVPADKFMNWAGGFTNVKAAGDYASSGGIPTTGMVSGGKITQVQLEHVWVEAAIDFRPSRGAINRSADTWVQLDPSFKQYEYPPGLDVISIAGVDPDALAQSFLSSSTINGQEGWISGLNPAILQSAYAQVQAAVKAHIQNRPPNSTVGEIVGERRIVSADLVVLPSALSNRSVVVGSRYSSLPGQLQHTMTFAFGLDPIGELIEAVTFPWAKLNNQKITLSFRPATAADEQALVSLLGSGSITDPSQLPSSIPSYLINVIPEIAVGGQVIAKGYAMRLGEDLNLVYDISRVGNDSHRYTYLVPAGSFLGVAVAGGSVATAKIEELKTKINRTKEILNSNDPSLIRTLSREHLLGDLFHASSLSYFGQYIAQSHIGSIAQKTSHNLAYAYGTLGYEPKVQIFFGFPRAINPGGVAVNVRLASVAQPRNGDFSKWRDFNMQTGLLSSALEHAVPEQMLSTPQQVVTHGVSAVKAIQLAAQQGQRIYRITPANQAQVIPNLHLDSLAMSEISQALAAGREVITHTDRINVSGWTGEGYILVDPMTGTGAYKITGGSNGGFLDDFEEMFTESLDFISLLAELIGYRFASWAADLADYILLQLRILNDCNDFWASWLTGFAIVFTLVGILAGFLVGAVFASLFWGAIVAFLVSYILVDIYIELVVDRRCPAP